MNNLKLAISILAMAAISDLAYGQANRSLSNLTSPTNINQSLLFNANNTFNIGSTTNALANLYTQNVFGEAGNDITVSAQSAVSGNGSSLALRGGDTSDSTAVNAGSVVVTAGTGIAGTGSTIGGDIDFTAGNGNGGAGNVNIVGGNVSTNTDLLGYILLKGHFHTSGPAVPTIGSCGTSPSNVGNDVAGRITADAGGTVTSCSLSFVQTWASAPVCFVSDETEPKALQVSASTTALTITASTAFAASSVLDYHCVTYQ